MKEYGKRYLVPVAEWWGFEFPDRIVKVLQPSLLTHSDACAESVHACQAAAAV